MVPPRNTNAGTDFEDRLVKELPIDNVAPGLSSVVLVVCDTRDYLQDFKEVSVTKAAELPGGWQNDTDPRSKKAFYVNHTSREWSWEPPLLDATVDLQSVQESESSESLRVMEPAATAKVLKDSAMEILRKRAQGGLQPQVLTKAQGGQEPEPPRAESAQQPGAFTQDLQQPEASNDESGQQPQVGVIPGLPSISLPLLEVSTLTHFYSSLRRRGSDTLSEH
jgi:hypothetical protein